MTSTFEVGILRAESLSDLLSCDLNVFSLYSVASSSSMIRHVTDVQCGVTNWMSWVQPQFRHHLFEKSFCNLMLPLWCTWTLIRPLLPHLSPWLWSFTRQVSFLGLLSGWSFHSGESQQGRSGRLACWASSGRNAPGAPRAEAVNVPQWWGGNFL